MNVIKTVILEKDSNKSGIKNRVTVSLFRKIGVYVLRFIEIVDDPDKSNVLSWGETELKDSPSVLDASNRERAISEFWNKTFEYHDAGYFMTPREYKHETLINSDNRDLANIYLIERDGRVLVVYDFMDGLYSHDCASVAEGFGLFAVIVSKLIDKGYGIA